VLNWVIVRLARAYFVFVLIAQVGVLQIIAARRRWVGLSFGNYWRRPGWGYGLGALLVGGAYVWFFASYPEIFQPGPAGTELTFLFVSAGILAVVVTVSLAEAKRLFLRWKRKRAYGNGETDAITLGLFRSLADEQIAEWGLGGERVSFGASAGVMFWPERKQGTCPAVCIVPGTYTGSGALRQVVEALLRTGFAVLLVEPDEGFLSYPEILAVLPTALSFLESRPEVDSERLGALGFGLGGNAILRSASTDGRVKAIIAVGALLGGNVTRPGLNILSELTYPQALKWSLFRRGKLISQLAAMDHLGKLGGMTLLIFGERDGLVLPRDRRAIKERGGGAAEVNVIPGATHFSLPNERAVVDLVTQWLEMRLGRGV